MSYARTIHLHDYSVRPAGYPHGSTKGKAHSSTGILRVYGVGSMGGTASITTGFIALTIVIISVMMMKRGGRGGQNQRPSPTAAARHHNHQPSPVVDRSARIREQVERKPEPAPRTSTPVQTRPQVAVQQSSSAATYRARPRSVEQALPQDHPYAIPHSLRNTTGRPDPVRQPHRPVDQNDYYAVLGIAPSASPAEIEEAFRRHVIKMHPDRSFRDTRRYEEGLEQLKKLNAIMLVLRDPARRAIYDATRGLSSSKQAGALSTRLRGTAA